MKKIYLALAATIIAFTSCVQNDPYIEPEESGLKGNLFLNEVNGTGGPSQLDAEKYVELYNKTNEDIDLKDFSLDYGGTETWRGRDADYVPAHGYKLIKSTKTVYPGMSTGLSSRNANVNLTLLDPEGNVVDYYEKVEDLNGKPLEQMCHMRIPDGGIKWYFVEISAQSPGATNLTDPNNPAVKAEMPPMEKGLRIEEVAVSATKPTPNDDVTIIAKITDVNVITSVVLKWKKGGADQPDITMTKDGSNYSATITKQPDGTVVNWTVSASNNIGKTVTESGTITWTTPAADYTKLKLNEVNGVDKWFEIYNTGDVEIKLESVSAHYSNTDPASWNATNTWTGTALQTIPAKGYFSTKGITLGTGLSANNTNVRLQLRAPDGTVLDTYEKLLNINLGQGFDHLTNKSHARIPDGTGPWYYTKDETGTSGATNGTSTDGCVKFGEEDGSVVTPDFSKLKINEVCGVGEDPDKYYELFNTGTVAINLEGFQMFYNANGSTGGTLPTGDGNLTWTGKSTHVIQPGAILYLLGRYNATSNPTGEFTTGLTPERILIITLKDPDGNVIDKCIRAQDTGDYARGRDESFSRIPDGTGPFYFTTPTPNKTNGTDVTGLVLVPATQ